MSTPNLNVNMQELLAPAKALNELALAKYERVVDLQLQAAARLSSVVLSASKEALEVQNVEGAQAFLEKRREIAAQVAQDMVRDAQIVAEISKEYAEEAGKVVAENVSKFTKMSNVAG